MPKPLEGLLVVSLEQAVTAHLSVSNSAHSGRRFKFFLKRRPDFLSLVSRGLG